MARADGRGERIAAALRHKRLDFVGIGQAALPSSNLMSSSTRRACRVPLDAEPLHGRDRPPAWYLDVFIERIVRGVNHDRAVEPAVDAIVTGLLVAVVEMHRVDGLGEISRRRG